MSNEFSPDFKKWLTFAGNTAASNGEFDPSWDERRAIAFLDNGVCVQSAIVGEAGKKVVKIDTLDTTHTFRYLGRINVYASDVHSEFLFVDDGRVWEHTDLLDNSTQSKRGFVDVSSAAEALDEFMGVI